MIWDDPTEHDIEVITAQLMRKPRGVVGIARRCPRGCPMVIVTMPIIKGPRGLEPFPTLFWLSCPYLVKEVSRLEALSIISKIESHLKVQDFLKRLLIYAHKEYRLLRRELLLKLEGVPQNLIKAVEETGIAGVRNFDHIKCLHAHYAHYLATGKNPVGMIVHKILQGRLSLETCGEPCKVAGRRGRKISRSGY